MPHQPPLHFVFYIAAPADKVWDGFVSPESNRAIFGALLAFAVLIFVITIVKIKGGH